MHCLCNDCDLILTRVCWSGSVGNLAVKRATDSVTDDRGGGLRSGLGASGPQLSSEDVKNHFRKHRYSQYSQRRKYVDKKHATALVSVSDRIIDTLIRAFRLFHKGETAKNIHIVFIRIPAAQKEITVLHSAMELAERCDLKDAGKFKNEFLFEWAVPSEFVMHSVTVDTLLLRGLDSRTDGLITEKGASTQNSCLDFAEVFFRDCDDAWDIGIRLGFFARCFGANAPSCWIAQQLCWDLTWRKGARTHGLPEAAWMQFPDEKKQYLDVFFWAEVADGIETCLIDWWVLDEDFLLAVQTYENWRDFQEDLMIDAQIGFYEDWVDGRDSENVLPGEILAREALEGRLERLQLAIDNEAIKVGL